MATTIQVKDRTIRLLDALKRATGARSYDEAIRVLLEEKFKLQSEMFGVDKGRISSFREEERLEDRE